MMKQDPEFAREIMEYIENKDSFPAGITEKELEEAIEPENPSFNLRHRQRIRYHVFQLHSAGFLIGGESSPPTRVLSGAIATSDYRFSRIDGLTPLGHEFVRYANSGIWEKAISEVKEKFGSITINSLFQVLLKLGADLIQK